MHWETEHTHKNTLMSPIGLISARRFNFLLHFQQRTDCLEQTPQGVLK